MKTLYSRRECLAALTAGAVLPHARVQAAPGPATGKAMRGAFMILNTPFTPSKAVDWEDLVREVNFVDHCGAHGMVWPQGSSGVATLTKDERMQGMEVLAKAAQGKKAALVLGVQGRDTTEMLEYARRAEALAPDALIAMPPSTGKSQDEYREYFRALAKVTTRPVILQTSGGARDLIPTTDLIVELARELPNFGYVKEESAPVVERMKALVGQRPPMKSVFGAEFGAGWLYEMRMGLDGVISGMPMYADLMATIWSLHERGESGKVLDAYSRFLLMRNLNQQVPGTDLYIMKKRGIFKTTMTRAATPYGFSPDAVAEIEYRFKALAPYLSQ
jgi:4-hydroxy-tetrahydrodipicolinate synthase